MQRWDSMLERYMEEYRATGVCGERALQVRRELERWGLWLKSRRPRPHLEAVDSEQVVQYVSSRTRFRAKATVSGVMSVLRCHGEWLVRQGHWNSNPLKWLRGPKLDPFARAPRRIDKEGMELLWRAAATRSDPYYRHLWLAVLGLLYGTGLRRGELERLDVSHYDAAAGTLLVDGRKTGRQRRAAVPELARRCLEAYLPERHNRLEQTGGIAQPALFVNGLGGRLSGHAVSRGVHGLAQRMKVSLASLHQFRHTCASELLEAGVRLPEVQQVLGHQSISTTVRYLHCSDPQRHEAVRRHPLNEWLREATP